MKCVLLVGLALALALAPTLASAHIETFSQAKPLVVGPYNAIVEPVPAPAFANTALTVRALFTTIETGRYPKSVDASLEFILPDGTNTTRALEPDGKGYYLASVAVRGAGEHVARIHVDEDGKRHTADTTVTVYPDVAVRLKPADTDIGDPFVGQPYPLGVAIVDNVTRRPSDVLTDLSVRLEHWTDDHTTLLSSQDLVLDKRTTAVWAREHVFPEKGMYHLRFASRSGGFNYDDVPLLHVYASDAPAVTDEDGARRESPLGLAALVVALALAVVLRRR